MSNVVRIFYNPQSFESILLVRCSDEQIHTYDKQEKVTRLFDKDEKLVGYNIEIYDTTLFHSGYNKPTEKTMSLINDILMSCGYNSLQADMENHILVGEVARCEKHPDSDHLHVCDVNIGSNTIQIVCGAHNVEQGIKVVVACIDAVLPNGLWIKKGSLRGIESNGMLCSAFELGLIEEKKKGILILDDSYHVGQIFEMR